jgi:hypothetical protein
VARALSHTQDAVISDLVRRSASDAPGQDRAWHHDTMIPGNIKTYAKLRSLGFIETQLRSYYFFSLRITDAGIAYYQEKRRG